LAILLGFLIDWQLFSYTMDDVFYNRDVTLWQDRN